MEQKDIRCITCGAEMPSATGRKKYCAACSKARKTAQQRIYRQKACEAKPKPAPKPRFCLHCKAPLPAEEPARTVCAACRKKAQQDAVRRHREKLQRPCKKCGRPIEPPVGSRTLCSSCRHEQRVEASAKAARERHERERDTARPALQAPANPSPKPRADRRHKVSGPITSRSSLRDLALAASQMGISYGKLSELLRQEEQRQQEEQQAKLTAARARMQAQAAAAETNVGDKEVHDNG